MSTKPVRLEEDVYELIEARKREDESFSEAIERLVRPPSLLELAGILDDDTAEEFREVIERADERSIEDRKRLRERFGDE